MRGLPVWLLTGMVVLTIGLLYIGWHDREEAGYLPFVMGIAFAIFTLASIGEKVRREDEH